MLLPVIGIIVIIGLIGYMAYESQSNSAINAIGSAFKTFTSGSPKEGFQIVHVEPVKPQAQRESTVNNQTSIYTETVQQTSDKISTYSVTNIPPIQGYITLYDANTNPIKPFSYDYRITISCSDIAESSFCNLDPAISNRGITTNAGTDENGNELGGKYFYDWSKFQTQTKILPSNVSEVYLDITVFVDSVDGFGNFVTHQSTQIIKIVP